MEDCLFCKIVAGDAPSYKIHEDDDTIVILDIFPAAKGHALVIPKNHAQDLSQGSLEDAQAMIKTVKEFGPRLVKALGGTAYNLGMNHGKDAGQMVFHTHMHLIPRFENDPRKFEKHQASSEELQAVYEEIMAGL